MSNAVAWVCDFVPGVEVWLEELGVFADEVGIKEKGEEE